MSHGLPIAKLERGVDRLRDLLADLGANHCNFCGHNHAEHTFDMIATMNPEGQPDIGSRDFDAAGVYEKLRTPHGVDLGVAHGCYFPTLGRAVAHQVSEHKNTTSPRPELKYVRSVKFLSLGAGNNRQAVFGGIS